MPLLLVCFNNTLRRRNNNGESKVVGVMGTTKKDLIDGTVVVRVGVPFKQHGSVRTNPSNDYNERPRRRHALIVPVAC